MLVASALPKDVRNTKTGVLIARPRFQTRRF